MIKPITPKEVVKNKVIDERIIEIFNKEITKNFKNNESIVYQDEVVCEIKKIMNISEDDIYKNKYLDVEPFYEECGWKVTYQKPAYYESHSDYPSRFIFTVKKV